MTTDLLRFDELGVQELTVVLDAVTPEAIEAAAERFDRDVVGPYREAVHEREAAERETYSL
jgi:hypothetical protein